MTRDFYETNGKTVREKLADLGTSFKFTVDNPEAVFLENGYRLLEKTSNIEKAVVFEAPEIPQSVLETIAPTLPKGYDTYVFEA